MAYINTNYLYKCSTCSHNKDNHCSISYCDYGEMYTPDMTKMPIASVVEKKYGTWVAERVSERDYDGSYSNYTEYICSECERSNGMEQANYCRHCGAEMKGAAEGFDI